MTGPGTLREVLQSRPFLVADPDSALGRTIVAALSAGADAFLPRPPPGDEVISVVAEGLGHRLRAAGGDAPGPGPLEFRLMAARPSAHLIFERYATSVECEELSKNKCVLKVENNDGLGTVLNLRFVRAGGEGAQAFVRPLKRIVTKIERIPRAYGWYRLHLAFQGPVREDQGIRAILSAAGGGL